jgi:hypothetical protein
MSSGTKLNQTDLIFALPFHDARSGVLCVCVIILLCNPFERSQKKKKNKVSSTTTLHRSTFFHAIPASQHYIALPFHAIPAFTILILFNGLFSLQYMGPPY